MRRRQVRPGEKPPKPPVKCTPSARTSRGTSGTRASRASAWRATTPRPARSRRSTTARRGAGATRTWSRSRATRTTTWAAGSTSTAKWNIHNMSHKIQFFGCGTICKDVEPLEDGTWGCGESSSVAGAARSSRQRWRWWGLTSGSRRRAGTTTTSRCPTRATRRTSRAPKCPNNQQLKVTHMEAKDGDFRAPGASLKFEFGTGSATCGDNVTLSTWVFDFAKGFFADADELREQHARSHVRAPLALLLGVRHLQGRDRVEHGGRRQVQRQRGPRAAAASSPSTMGST